MSRADLKIADSEFVYAEQILMTYIKRLLDAANAYITIMNRVRDEAVDDGLGRIASNCERRAGRMMTDVVVPLSLLTFSLSGQANGFISTIDQIDQFIYGEK